MVAFRGSSKGSVLQMKDISETVFVTFLFFIDSLATTQGWLHPLALGCLRFHHALTAVCHIDYPKMNLPSECSLSTGAL